MRGQSSLATALTSTAFTTPVGNVRGLSASGELTSSRMISRALMLLYVANIHTHSVAPNTGSDSQPKQFFNISQAEAHAIDPQQRILLEVTYQALENGTTGPLAPQGLPFC